MNEAKHTEAQLETIAAALETIDAAWKTAQNSTPRDQYQIMSYLFGNLVVQAKYPDRHIETPNHWARVALRAVQFAADINRAEAQIHHETPPLSYSNE